MQSIISSILGALGRFFVDKLSFFLAGKALFLLLIISVLPVVLKNLFNWFITSIYSVISSHVDTGAIDSFVLEFTGIGAYLASHLQFSLCLSILLTAITVRFVLNMIPFIR